MSVLQLQKVCKGSKSRLNNYMEKDYAGLTTCKVTALGDFVTSESFSATSCSGMLKK